ncbi:MAG: ATP-binding protein [Planctomycetota bacterium]
MEFKERIPEQKHELSKELAAFGSSGGGFLFVGINDNCQVIGIDAPNGDDRDKQIRDMRGIVNTVKPELSCRVGFATCEKRTVLFVEVAEQSEPLFYYQGKPYVRVETESRPATPDEVKECVWSHPSAEFNRAEEELKLEEKRLELQQLKRHHENMNAISRAAIPQ